MRHAIFAHATYRSSASSVDDVLLENPLLTTRYTRSIQFKLLALHGGGCPPLFRVQILHLVTYFTSLSLSPPPSPLSLSPSLSLSLSLSLSPSLSLLLVLWSAALLGRLWQKCTGTLTAWQACWCRRPFTCLARPAALTRCVCWSRRLDFLPL